MATLTALLDACVLYPAPLRDLLMRLTVAGLFRARWTAEIHEEWIRNVLKNRTDLTRKQLERTRDLMNAHVEHCLVRGYQKLIPSLTLPDPDDRHVLAAAISARANVIVTYNTADFPASRMKGFQIEAQHPDPFVERLLDLDASGVCEAVRLQRTALKKPPVTVEEMLDVLAQQRLSRTVARLREFADIL